MTTQLNELVTLAILLAERLERDGSPHAAEAFDLVCEIELQLADVYGVGEVDGQVARLGAVTAALSAHRPRKALQIAGKFLSEARDMPMFADQLRALRREAEQASCKAR